MLFTVGGVNRVRNELDPHIVTGILQKTLKELSPSPFHEVYEDILATEINEDLVQERQTVQNWLVKLPQDRFELVSTIKIVVDHFAYLKKLFIIDGFEPISNYFFCSALGEHLTNAISITFLLVIIKKYHITVYRFAHYFPYSSVLLLLEEMTRMRCNWLTILHHICVAEKAVHTCPFDTWRSDDYCTYIYGAVSEKIFSYILLFLTKFSI